MRAPPRGVVGILVTFDSVLHDVTPGQSREAVAAVGQRLVGGSTPGG